MDMQASHSKLCIMLLCCSLNVLLYVFFSRSVLSLSSFVKLDGPLSTISIESFLSYLGLGENDSEAEVRAQVC